MPDVAVDQEDRVYLFNRSEHPVLVFDRDGNFISSWGEGVFGRPHGLTIVPDGTLYCADDGHHVVFHCTPEGRILEVVGEPDKPAPFMSGKPFNRPTKVALDPAGTGFYVTDGYGNARVHRFSLAGEWLASWGEPGTDPGQFNVVHSLAVSDDGQIYVADRENHRVQVFDHEGKYLTQWNNTNRACGIHIHEGICYVGDFGTSIGANAGWPHIGPRLSLYNLDGLRLAHLGDNGQGEGPDQFIAPHGVAVDSRGDIYVAEVSWTVYGSLLNPPRPVRCFRKLVKITG